MNKTQLIDRLSEMSGESKKASESILNAFIETVTEELSNGGTVALIGFGTFSTSARSARQGRNPQTGEALEIKARTVANFKVGSQLKQAVNK